MIIQELNKTKPIDKSIRNMKYNKTKRLKWNLLEELIHGNQEHVI